MDTSRDNFHGCRAKARDEALALRTFPVMAERVSRLDARRRASATSEHGRDSRERPAPIFPETELHHDSGQLTELRLRPFYSRLPSDAGNSAATPVRADPLGSNPFRAGDR